MQRAVYVFEILHQDGTGMELPACLDMELP